MKDILIILVLVAIVGAAVLYIRRAKKAGQKCIGCPMSATCGSKGSCACNREQ